MTSDPTSVIQESIEQLERLSALLAGDVPAGPCANTPLPLKTRISKEAMLTISVLIPKLRAARGVHVSDRRAHQTCLSCDE